jgi:hypothetical protein
MYSIVTGLTALFSRPDLPLVSDAVTSSSTTEEEDDDECVLDNDDYFQKCRYAEHRSGAARCYDLFSVHSPLVLYANHVNQFTRYHLRGLEYLMDSSTTATTDEVDFPCVYIDVPGVSRPLDTVEDTYVVNRLADYVYSYIIDIAFLRNRVDGRLLPLMNETRQRYRSHRIRSYTQCTRVHRGEDATRCPLEWVVYTKKTSKFFTECLRQFDQNPVVTYDINESYLNITPISFNLVSFLCGPFVNTSTAVSTTTTDVVIHIEQRKKQYVVGYDQWVIVPIFFIDLWYMMHPRPVIY